jgi:hypothetical protein
VRLRAAIALLIAGVLVATAACTGSTPDTPSPSASAQGSPTGSSPTGSPAPDVAGTVFADGTPLPDGCPAGANARSQTVAFVASGNAWVLDPSSGDATCVFAAPQPDPFAWNPRGDRALLSGLAISSIAGELVREPSLPEAPVSSWGNPIGKAVVYISPSGRRLLKVYPGTQRRDDITPVAGVRYLNVVYHPSGLAIGFVIDAGDGQEIWLSSNLGEEAVRLVFAVGETTFGQLDFTADGRTLLYGAVHADDAPLLHALDLTDPTINQGLWHGEEGDRITALLPQPEREGELVAMTVGAACEDARAMLYTGGGEARELAPAPSRSVGWLDAQTVLVATGGCDGASSLASVDVTQEATIPLVSGVDIAAARTPLLDFVPELPEDIEEEVGEGVG